ncbi:MAG: mechanosensitive ion channel family protein [Mucilaginibacter sp.]
MQRLLKITAILLLIVVSSSQLSFAQAVKSKQTLKREAQRRATHLRDSVLKSINRSDTSVNSLLQRIEKYTTTYNQINNSLAEGLDTADVSAQLPPVVKRLDKIATLGNTHKSSTLRYLFVLRDNLDHLQNELEGWQADMNDVSAKLIQYQTDLLKFPKDTLLKSLPSDSAVRNAFFLHRKTVALLWRKVDSTNRKALLKVNLLQDRISVSYTKLLDETDHIDSRIKSFTVKAISGESTYIWTVDDNYADFSTAFKSTIKLNQLLFHYFEKNEISTHLVVLLFFVLIFSWLLFNRARVIQNNDLPEPIFSEANSIYKHPVISSLLVVTAITPYFYDHPPTVFLEVLFLISIVLTLILIKKHFQKASYNFLLLLFGMTVVYCISNLFIQLSNIDRYIILALSIISVISGIVFYKKVKKSPDAYLPYTGLALKLFVGLQAVSVVLNTTGRFSLAKIISITAVFNLWFVIILYLVINIIIEGLYLQFQTKKGGNSFFNWVDYTVVKNKFKSTLTLIASLLWLFFLLQNLTLDDWTVDAVKDLLDQSQSIGGASFTFGGFVIFIFVIWLSSIVSKIISYFYDVSAQRVSDLSVAKRRNRTSTLLIRMGVFSAGFLLAVAASGFPLEKLTIIISAFGVGIGFGLQNIVNNLVSGLILAFEKPIQIGDIIEVDGISGTMKEIGIRSSKIATADGSEVIVPNGDLISHHVINWTLSNTNRQANLIINTAYGVNIDAVKALLKGVLSGRDDIMATPGPAVFVNSVTPSVVEFKVFFWAADITKVSELKSNVLADIYTKLQEEHIAMPAPQKDFYLHFPDGEQVLKPNENTETEKKGNNTDTSKNPLDQGQ